MKTWPTLPLGCQSAAKGADEGSVPPSIRDVHVVVGTSLMPPQKGPYQDGGAGARRRPAPPRRRPRPCAPVFRPLRL